MTSLTAGPESTYQGNGVTSALLPETVTPVPLQWQEGGKGSRWVICMGGGGHKTEEGLGPAL